VQKGRLVGVLLLSVGLGPLLGLAQGVALAQPEIAVNTFTVADHRNDQIHPRISGDFVVWQDYRDIGAHTGDDYNADIWAKNLAGGDEIKVTDNHTSSRPAISGDIVVYADKREGDPNIRGYDVRTDDSFWITRKADSVQDRPAIDGNIVVWQDNRNGNFNIRARDLTSDNEFWVSQGDSSRTNPRISGKVVVWEDDRDGCCDVFAKNIDSGNVTRVTDSNDAHEPDVSGSWVVYRKGDGDRNTIMAFNLDSGERVRLNGSRDNTRQQPSIDGRLAVWADRRNGDDFNVFVYDFQTNTESLVVREGQDQLEPAVSGSRVVWTDQRGDRGAQIRGADLTLPAQPTPTPTTSIPAPPVGQPVPPGPCFFQLGFKTLRDMIPGIVGDCRENEWHNAVNGDGLQQTTGGLLVWRKADNWTAFTNGSITWLNGPCGLQTRPNEGPFYAWEGRLGAPCS